MAGTRFCGRLLFLLAFIVCFIAYVCETRRGGGGGRGGSRSSRYGRRSRKGGVEFNSVDGHLKGLSLWKILLYSGIAAVVTGAFCWFCCCTNRKITSKVNDFCLGPSKNTSSGSVKHAARPEPSDVDNSSPSCKHTTTSHYTAARDNDTDDVTIPLSSDSNVNDTTASNSDSGNKDSLLYSAEDSGNYSACYSIVDNTEAGDSDSAEACSSARYSTSTSTGLPYSTKPPDDYSTRYTDGLLSLTESAKLKPRGKVTFVNCSDNQAAEQTPAPTVDNDYPTSKHTTPTDYNDNNRPEPPSYENAINFSASPSADFTTDTTSGLPYSMNYHEENQ